MKNQVWLAGLFAALSLALCAGCAGQKAHSAEKPAEAIQRVAAPETEAAPEQAADPAALLTPEKEIWAEAAKAYEAFFTAAIADEAEIIAYPDLRLQMIDLEQDGTPELVIYYGVSTGVSDFLILTTEAGAVKSLRQKTGSPPAEIMQQKGAALEALPGALEDAPEDVHLILTEPAHTFMRADILPYDAEYGAFSARKDEKTGELFWLFTCLNNRTVFIDDRSYQMQGEFWRFIREDGESRAVALEKIALDWDEAQPFAELEKPGEVVAASAGMVPVVAGEKSLRVTEQWLSQRDAAWQSVDAPEESRLWAVTGADAAARMQSVREFFASF